MRADTQNAEVQGSNVRISFVRGIHNHISDALSRSPVGGSEDIERALPRPRGHASYVYNRVVTCVTEDIYKEVIEDPALDDKLEAARLDKGYQSVAETIKQKKDKEVYKTVSTAAIKEYIGYRVERMSVIEKWDAMIMLMDQTRIVVPPSMRKKLINREHLAHTGINKMQMTIRAKYFWPGIEADVKKIVGGVQAMPATQQDSEKGPTQAGLGVCELADTVGWHRLLQETLELVPSLNGPLLRIAKICSDVLQYKTAHTFKELKRWISTLA